MNTARTPALLVEPLAWDTDFWGVTAARIWATNTHQLREAVVECKRRGIRWASLLVPIADTELVNSAVRAGFEIVDVRVTLSASLDRTDQRMTVSVADPSELQQAEEIVDGAFGISRFSADPHLSRERANQFYRTWVRNSFSGEMADAIVVSRHEGLLDALVTVRQHEGGAASMPLVAVRRDRRGTGVGARVVADARTWLARGGCTTVDVITQLANLAAIRLYESAGFSVREAGVWLHYWLDPGGPLGG